MRWLQLFLLVAAGAQSVHAEDQSVRVKTTHFADKQLEQQSELDEKAQAALKAWIQISKCEYLSPDPQAQWHDKSARPAKPEIFKMQAKSCDGSGKPQEVPYCAGMVKCENRFIKYVFKDVFCKANSARSCPDAKSCALDTHLTRAIPPEYQSEHKKQNGFARQDIRGWEPGHTNRYSWTMHDEEALQTAVKDQEGED